ncbi:MULTISPECIES: SDR family NAD(P)-dependent oxidoreductase [unclassified Pseudonocardia]|uniref:SDR family NAD(P)-dependent oxidoreductase n=1 Tax=unclassified Pseudonocardia TaxID=2619320 RepID=UPI0001FFDDEB|nr:SDR family NAD(P)-dependent oxidoreductase [Pseudonocardia sp. Ae707_Ps1]OLM16786.1 Oxidoreductase, short chain dehydrogenase/reductase family [Pseudonocardia sp. Ae707_Ps1]
MAGVEGRVVAVTGAGNGLGRQYALLLARSGAKVVVNDLGGTRDGAGAATAAADAVVAEIAEAGGEAVANHDSVADATGGSAIVQTALDAFGRIDGVVANAGILRDSAFHKMSTEDWDAVQQVHLYGAYHVVRAAWPHLREQRHGRVVVAASTSGVYGNFGQSNYGAAKGGLIGLINTLAIEGAKYGVHANAIAPMAATRMTEDVAPPEILEKLDPAHVAPVVGHLLADECEESGSVIVAGGGQVHRVRWFQTKGVTFSDVPTIDQVADRWSEIVDLDGAVPGTNPVG